MAPRVPVPADFSKNVAVGIIPPPGGKAPASAVILLHGLGDTNESFTNLGRQLNLPETVCISLQALTPLPFDLSGFHWGDDIVFDQASGQMDVDTGFEKAARVIADVVIRDSLINKCGFTTKDVMLFGFGQGGMAALATAKVRDIGELGGIVSIGGPLPEACIKVEASSKNATPVLVLHGSSKSLITTTAANNIKAAFTIVQVHGWRRPGDGMPTNRDEMMPIMQFFARRLRSRVGVPKGSQEIA